MRTLVVDDDQICRSLLQHVLTAYGPVVYAVDGIGAVAEVARSLAEGKPFDLITLDIMMPDLDGQKTLTIIRRLEAMFGCDRPAHIAMTTALDDKDNLFRSFREQADFYFIKPIKIDRVRADLQKAGLISA
jgi:two-component system chemotaxis response regulator CheY